MQRATQQQTKYLIILFLSFFFIKGGDPSISPASKEDKDHDLAEGHDTKIQIKSSTGYFDAEVGLRPGDSVRLPLGNGFSFVRIKFVGFRNRHLNRNRAWRRRWQKRLCRVLCDICDGDSQNVKRDSKFFKVTSMGERYVKIKTDPDERFVRRHLQGHEIRFQVQLLKRQSRSAIVINYGIILRSHQTRRGRAINSQHFSVPHEEWFPNYKQHQHGQCMTGSGPVAWAMMLGYYDNLARRASEL